MQSLILGLLAETHVHPGAGRSLGAIDLPVAREAATDFPVIVGSSLKGALRDRTETILDKSTAEKVFGQQDNAGALLVSDARLLLLPVRSLSGQYQWTTCPLILERLKRDVHRAGLDISFEIPASISKAEALAAAKGHLFLEERQLQVTGQPPQKVVSAIQSLIGQPDAAARLPEQLAILNNDDFAWFARYALTIQARNVLDDETKQSNNLWYEESLPPDSVFYTLLAVRATGNGADPLNTLGEIFKDPYLQAGGNETVGHGWFLVKTLKNEGGES